MRDACGSRLRAAPRHVRLEHMQRGQLIDDALALLFRNLGLSEVACRGGSRQTLVFTVERSLENTSKLGAERVGKGCLRTPRSVEADRIADNDRRRHTLFRKLDDRD